MTSLPRYSMILALALALAFASASFAQQPVQIWFPQEKSEQPIRIETLSIDSQVHGIMAQTRLELEFYNPNARVLEGEFVLPLLPTQTVVGYALEVNGALREGVVVPKQKARVVFEEITRRGIDPGLAELTRGNVFRTRIYPIPAKGKKRIAITIDQHLTQTNKGAEYAFPVPVQTKLARFDVRIQAQSTAISETDTLALSDAKIAQRSQRNVIPEAFIRLTLPPSTLASYTLSQAADQQAITLIPLTAPKLAAAPVKAKTIAVYWDASRSGLKRDHQQEIAFLQAMIAQTQAQSFTLTVFRNTVDSVQSYTNASAMVQAIQALEYDGASAIHSMAFSERAELALLFTDGDSNFDPYQSARSDAGNSARTVIVHAASQINANGLAQLAERLNANIVPLNTLATNQYLTAANASKVTAKVAVRSGRCVDAPIVRQLQGEQYLLSARCSPKSQFDVIWRSGAERVAQTLMMSASSGLSADQSAPLARLFASQRVQHLSQSAPVNVAAIQSIAVQFGVVSEWTSLLVLESIEDYVEFGVEPKETDLQAQYQMAMRDQRDQKEQDSNQHLRTLVNQWQSFKTWHSTPRYVYGDSIKAMATQVSEQVSDNAKLLKRVKSIYQQAEALALSKMHLDAREQRFKELYRQLLDVQQAWLASLSKSQREQLDKQPMQASVRRSREEAKEVAFMSDSAPSVAAAPAPVSRVSSDEAALDEVTVTGANLEKPIASEADDSSDAGATQASINIKAYESDAAYIKRLRAAKNAYASFLIEAKNDGSAGFYLDCAEFFYAEKRDAKLALRVLSNIAETQVESVDALRVLATQLSLWKQSKLALAQFELAKNLRSEEPQGLRDFALALHASGYSKLAQELLWQVISQTWDDRFDSITLTALHEFNDIYANTATDQRVDAAALGIPKALIGSTPVGLRVVMGWSANDVDMDLWVLDPSGEWAYYQQQQTTTGGQMSDDFTAGYGPETFTIATPIAGTYRVFANYFANHQQKLAVPISVYLNFQTPFNARKTATQSVIRRLDTSKQVQEVGSFTVQ
jgi:Ca-activated chloride channel homolog